MDGFNLSVTITDDSIRVDAEDVDRDDELAVKLAQALPVLTARVLDVHPARDRLLAAADAGDLTMRFGKMERHPDRPDEPLVFQVYATLDDDETVSVWTMEEAQFVEAVNRIDAELADRDGAA